MEIKPTSEKNKVLSKINSSMEKPKEVTITDVTPIIDRLMAEAMQKPKEEFELPSAVTIITEIIKAYPHAQLGLSPELQVQIEAEIAKSKENK